MYSVRVFYTSEWLQHCKVKDCNNFVWTGQVLQIQSYICWLPFGKTSSCLYLSTLYRLVLQWVTPVRSRTSLIWQGLLFRYVLTSIVTGLWCRQSMICFSLTSVQWILGSAFTCTCTTSHCHWQVDVILTAEHMLHVLHIHNYFGTVPSPVVDTPNETEKFSLKKGIKNIIYYLSGGEDYDAAIFQGALSYYLVRKRDLFYVIYP